MTTAYSSEQLDKMEDLFEKNLPPVPLEKDKEGLPIVAGASASGSPFGMWVRFRMEADQDVS